MSDADSVVVGEAAGVPYVAMPPPAGDTESAQLIVGWHANDPPRSAAALAAALPLAGVPAWRVYLDLPMHGRRQLPGGMEEFMQRAYADAVLNAFEPQVSQAVAEFPAVLAALRSRLPMGDGPIGLVGASIGALPAQLVLADRLANVSAAVLISPVIRLAEVVAVNERRFDVTYPWTDASRRVADHFDLIARAPDIAACDPQPALLCIVGADDDPAFLRQSELLRAELRQRYRDPQRVAVTTIPDMGHAFAAEPGIDPAPQTPAAVRVEAAAADWFARHL